MTDAFTEGQPAPLEAIEEVAPDDPNDPDATLTEDEAQDLVEAEPTASSVTYSGQDFDVAGLVRRLNSDDILIPTFGHQDARISSAGFQRSFVWTRPQMDRFIESLLLGYPVPGIFLVRQQADRRYLVLDGQQRLRTLQHFMAGLHDGREFVLQNVADEFKGLTYKSIPNEMRRLLEDTFFQATIVVSDGSPASLEAIYKVFERVNSGGTQLTPHEIRVALYAGQLIDFLEQLNTNVNWRQLYGRKSPRLRDQELILRILALLNRATSYRRPLKKFLNDFASDYRNLGPSRSGLEAFESSEISRVFAETARVLRSSNGRTALRPGGSQLNAALTEAIFVGLMRRVSSASVPSVDATVSALQRLAGDGDLTQVTSRATADEETVKRRLQLCTAAFAEA